MQDLERLKTTLNYRDSVLSDMEERISELSQELLISKTKYTDEITSYKRENALLKDQVW